MRERISKLKAHLELGLATLGAVVAGNARYAALKLEELRELCLPLIASPLVGRLLVCFALYN